MFPSDIALSIRRLRSSGGSMLERANDLSISGVLTGDDWTAWNSLAIHCPWPVKHVIVRDELDEVVPTHLLISNSFVGKPVRIFVQKHDTPGLAYFFTVEGFRGFLAAEEGLLSTSRIAVAEECVPFAARSFTVRPWLDDEEGGASENEVPSIRPFGRSDAIANSTRNVNLWLRANPSQTLEGECAGVWRSVGAPKIAAALATEVWREADSVQLVFDGPRRRRVFLKSDDQAPASYELLEVGEWVYTDEREAEVRHTLLASELAREWPANEEFFQGFRKVGADALASARMAYRLHLQGETDRTVKQLSDLRKSLADALGEIGKQSRDLIGALWRDTTIGITAAIGKIILDSNPERNAVIARLVIGVAALGVGASAIITLRTSHKFVEITAAGVQRWRTKLFGFLEDQEIETLVNEPIGDAKRYFLQAEVVAAIVYALVTLCLIAFACVDVGTGGRSERNAPIGPSPVSTQQIPVKNQQRNGVVHK